MIYTHDLEAADKRMSRQYAEVVRRERIARGWTLHHMGQLAEVLPKSIERIEQGKSTTTKTLHRVLFVINKLPYIP